MTDISNKDDGEKSSTFNGICHNCGTSQSIVWEKHSKSRILWNLCNLCGNIKMQIELMESGVRYSAQHDSEFADREYQMIKNMDILSSEYGIDFTDIYHHFLDFRLS